MIVCGIDVADSNKSQWIQTNLVPGVLWLLNFLMIKVCIFMQQYFVLNTNLSQQQCYGCYGFL